MHKMSTQPLIILIKYSGCTLRVLRTGETNYTFILMFEKYKSFCLIKLK